MISKSIITTVLGTLFLTTLIGSVEAQDAKIRVSEVLRSQFYLPMYVALGKGYTKEEGLEVEVISAGGGDRAGALMLAGSVDIALAGPEVAIYIHNGESLDKPVIFCALTGTDGYFLVSREKIENFTWTVLNGRKILGTRPGSTPTLYLNSLLKRRGVDSETIKSIITNIGQQARDGAFLSGIADFATFTEPALTRLEKAGRLHVLASIGKEVGRADYTVFMARKSWIEKHPEIAQKWTNAIARAQVWMRAADAPEIAKVVSPYFPALAAEDAIATIERFRGSGAPIWSETTEVDREGLRRAQEMMVEGGTLPAGKVVPYDVLVTTRFSQKAQQQFAK